MGRLRNSKGLPNYFRLTSNPTRHQWLRELFQISPDGKDTHFKKLITLPNGTKVNKDYRFISARLEDNPYINYEEYASQIMSMNESIQKAWLDGRWDSFDTIDGLIYFNELTKAKNQGRISRINYDPALDLDVYSDMGRDCFTLLFVQRLGNEIRIIKEYHNQNIDITHYIQVLKDIIKVEGWKVNRWILPHDAASKNVNSDNSPVEIAQSYCKDITVLATPRIDNLSKEQGIANTLRLFKDLYINPSCTFLLESLEKYGRRYNKQTGTYGEPIHNLYSHMSDCLRYVCQDTYHNKTTPTINVNHLLSLQTNNFSPW